MGGGAAALLNLGLIYGLITVIGWETPLLRNLANFVAIELSLVSSFFIYRIWVWPGGSWRPKRLLLEQLPLYHLSAGAALLLRVLVIFPMLDRLGVNYLLNTLVGVAVGATINYLLSDRLVFNRPSRLSPSLSESRNSVIYRPEGLAPAAVDSPGVTGLDPMPLGESIHDQLSVVMPAYNEEGSIISTVEAIVEVLSAERIAYEILIVNDNSRDRTESLLQELSDRYQSVRYLNNYYPNGFGFAVRCGLENFAGDAVAIVMADCSDRPEDIVRYFYKLQEGYDCVFGSRFMKGGKVIDYPAHKLFINRLANLFIQVIFSLGFNDTTNAFKLYRRDVIEGISPLISHHFNLTVEMPLKAISRGYSYTTMPITWQNRKTGVSKLKIKEMGSRYLFVVLYIWLERHLARGDYHRSNRKKMAKING